MEEVTALALQVSVTPSDRLALFLPVVRAVFLPREIALSTFQPFAYVREVRRLDSSTITVVDVFQNTQRDMPACVWPDVQIRVQGDRLRAQVA